MSSWAKPGVKCVCINGDWSRIPAKLRSLVVSLPIEGQVYTIRRVRSYSGHGIVLLFDEIRNPHVQYGRWDGEPQFSIKRFEPLADLNRETDLFHHLLSPSPADVGLIPAGVELVE